MPGVLGAQPVPGANHQVPERKCTSQLSDSVCCTHFPHIVCVCFSELCSHSLQATLSGRNFKHWIQTQLVIVTFSAAVTLSVLPLVVGARCRYSDPCIDEYNPITKVFTKIGWDFNEVPSDIPGLTVGVSLQMNDIIALPAGVFSHLSQCTWLELQQNEIYTVDKDAFKGLVKLEYLNLDRNNTLALEPGTFSDLSECKQLYIPRNKITSLAAGVFRGLSKCTKFDIGVNDISYIDKEAFAGLWGLRELYLHDNELTSIDRDLFAPLWSMWRMRLSNNILTTLPAYIFENKPRPFSLDIHGEDRNQWDCSSLCWLKHEEQHGTITFIKSKPVCAGDGDWDSLDCGDKGDYLHFILNNCWPIVDCW